MKKDRVVVGLATCGIAAGGVAVYDELEEQIKERNLSASLEETGCIGYCFAEVLVEIEKEGMPKVTYGDVTVKDVPAIVESHLVNGEILRKKALLIEGEEMPETDFLALQTRIVLRNCGLIDPDSIDE
jgi:NADH-quinone oxidoreductase subunit F